MNQDDNLLILSRHAASLQAFSTRRRIVRPASDSRPRIADRGDYEMKADLKAAILDEMVIRERRVLMTNKEYRKVEKWRKLEVEEKPE